VEAAVDGSNSVPGLAALAVVVEFVNDRPPTVTVDTFTDNGLAEVSASAPAGTFVAHISASDPNRGPNGHVTCRLDSYGDHFRLVRMFDGEYKMLTERSLDAVGVVVVAVSCRDHGNPPLSTSTNVSVTVTAARAVNIPVFTQPVYNVTVSVASRAPVFVIRVLAAAPNLQHSAVGTVSYSFARPYPAFTVDRTTGVVRMVADSLDAATTELVVIAAAAYGGGSSSATVYVTLAGRQRVGVFENAVTCRVREDAGPGTTVCTLADTGANLAANRCLYFDLVDAADGRFWADPFSGVVYTNGSLDRELVPGFRLTARVQLDAVPTRVVDVLLDVEVEDVNDCAPQFTFPSAENYTVRVDTSASQWSSSGLMLVTVASASDADELENGRVTYSVVANSSDSRYFVVEPSTGEVYLNVVVDRLDEFINRSFEVYIAATDRGRPSLQSVALLRVTVPAWTPTSSRYSEPGSESRLVILAGVLSSFVLVVVVICAAIFIVCRRSRRRKPPPSAAAVNVESIWPGIHMQRSESSSEGTQSTSSRSATSPKPPASASSDVDRSLHLSLSPLTLDIGADYFQRYEVYTQSHRMY